MTGHLNLLLVIGIIMLLGMVGGRVIRLFHLPQVMGYIIIGLFLGKSFHGFLQSGFLDSLNPIVSLALGIIGFMIGSEIHRDRFKRYSRSIYTILFVEAFLTFFLVFSSVFLLTGKMYMGLILGALASATAPAATYSVIGEYKARGPVTMTTLSIVALDDALALLIYGFASVFAKSLIVHEDFSLIRTMVMPLLHISISVVIGIVSGYAVHIIASKTSSREKMLSCILGTIIVVVGLSEHFKVDPILATMVLGAMASNLQSMENREMFDLIKRFSPPIFILFFVLIGARLDARIAFQGGVLTLATAYLLSRSVGKVVGAYIGAKLSNAKESVTKYLGFCLFDQAGVAVGLALATYNTFNLIGGEARLTGMIILNVITASTFILQLVSPPMIKFGIKKADEINRNITEEDIVGLHKVSDVMEKDFFVIRENNNLHQIIDIMKRSDDYNFPVVKMNGDFLGIISLGEMRDTFNEDQMDMLVLAGDIAKEIVTVTYADEDLKNVMGIFKKRNVDYIPVLRNKESNKLVGQLEYRKLMDHITREVILRQQELEV